MEEREVWVYLKIHYVQLQTNYQSFLHNIFSTILGYYFKNFFTGIQQLLFYNAHQFVQCFQKFFVCNKFLTNLPFYIQFILKTNLSSRRESKLKRRDEMLFQSAQYLPLNMVSKLAQEMDISMLVQIYQHALLCLLYNWGGCLNALHVILHCKRD